jgi:hypothetical protein
MTLDRPHGRKQDARGFDGRLRMSDGVMAGSGPAKAPTHRPALLRQVVQLAAAGDHAAICRLVMLNPPQDPLPPLVAHVLDAALEVHHQPALAWALESASRVPLPPKLRVRLGWRLSRHQKPVEALDLLVADPTLPDQPDCAVLLASACAAISVSALAPEEVRKAAGALSQRCLRIEGGGFTDSGLHFRQQSPCPSLQPAGGLVLAPGAPPRAAPMIRNVLRQRTIGTGRRTPAANIVTYRDVLVDRWGRIWRRDGTVLHFDGPLAGRLPARDVPDAPVHDVAVLAAGNTNNPYHWFGGVLPGLAFRFDPGAPDLPILIRADSHHYHAESLRLVGGPDVPLLSVDDGVFVRELIVPRGAGALGLHPGGAARPLFDRMIAAAGPPEAAETGRRIFISRRDTDRRRAGNEEALEQVFVDRGFTPMVLRGMPLDARIRLMQGAAALAGTHGAGLTMIFAGRAGTPVYEVLPWMPNSLPTRLCMAVISGQFGLRHRLWVEPSDEARGTWEPHLGPLAADLDAFLAQG